MTPEEKNAFSRGYRLGKELISEIPPPESLWKQNAIATITGLLADLYTESPKQDLMNDASRLYDIIKDEDSDFERNANEFEMQIIAENFESGPHVLKMQTMLPEYTAKEVQDAYFEGFTNGSDHGKLGWMHPPVEISFIQSDARDALQYTKQIPQNQLDIVALWYETRGEIDLPCLDDVKVIQTDVI